MHSAKRMIKDPGTNDFRVKTPLFLVGGLLPGARGPQEKGGIIVGLDSGILMHPKIWEASGHVGAFNDPLVDCKQCKARYRADEFSEDFSFLIS